MTLAEKVITESGRTAAINYDFRDFAPEPWTIVFHPAEDPQTPADRQTFEGSGKTLLAAINASGVRST
jgi:hypothetical protein